MKLVEDGAYDEAIAFFEKPGERDFLGDYGLATALFRKRTDDGCWTCEDLSRIEALYESAIEKNAQFADAHFMLSYTHVSVINALLQTYREQPVEKLARSIRARIRAAKARLEKARELNPAFDGIIRDVAAVLDRQETTLRELPRPG